ncbi:MAG: bifunctional GNAT family N-acetyltransferase/serine/threonine-protein kinase, partial [Candidatus Omnitrophota bacterium]
VILWSEGVLATDPVDGSSVWILKQRMFSENEKEANELLEEAVDNFSPRDVVDDKPLDQVDLDDIQNRFRAIREERAAQQERLREAEEVLRVARLEGAISQARDQGRVISTTESGAEIFDAQSIIQGDEETLGIIHTILPGVIDSAFGGLIEKVEEITEQDLRENRVFLAVIGGRIVGAIGYAIYDDLQMGSIKMVAVVKVLQNTGIGSALLDQAMRAFLKARDNGRINELRFASLDDAVYMTYFGNRGYRPKIEEGVLTLALAPEPAAVVERRIPVRGPEEVPPAAVEVKVGVAREEVAEVEEEAEAPEVTAEGLEKAGEVINRCFKTELAGSAEPQILIDNITKSRILADELDEITLEWIRSKGAIARIFNDLLIRSEKKFEFLKKIGAENIDMEDFLITRLKIIWLKRGQPDRAPPYSSREKVLKELRTMYPYEIFGQHDMASEEDYFETASGAVVTNKEKVVQGEGPYGNKYHVATIPDESGQEVEVLFGESGFAVVYLGYEANEDDSVVIKTVSDMEEKVALFREAAILQRLKEKGMRDGVVEMRDMGVFVPLDKNGNPEKDAEGNEATSYYMATTWAGASIKFILKDRADRGKAFSAFETKQFAVGILKVLNQLHNKGILHLDIKPANIFLKTIGITDEGEPIYDFSNPILGDFGTTLEVRDTAELKRIYERYGSYLYMPPESTAFAYHSARSDLYAFGWTLYETLMGAFPDNDDPYYYLHNPPE